MAHHVLRSEKAGSIFKRVSSMLNLGHIKFKDRPLWYDGYVLYPPIDEPQWDRKWPNRDGKVRSIFYAEDIQRAEKATSFPLSKKTAKMVEGYNRSLTIFSPDGHLFQVDYAQEAVKKGSNVIGIKGKGCVVLGVEKKSVSALQDDRVLRKIFAINENVILSYAGLSADARVLINYVRKEVENHRLSYDEFPTVTNVARIIADLKQDYTITGGRRPFGVSMIIAGFDDNGCPSIFKTEPMGTYFEYKAVAIGRSDKAVMEFLEANYNDESIKDEESVLKLAVKALTLVVQSGADIELSVVRMDKPPVCVHRSVPVEEISAMIKINHEEKEKELKD